MREDRRKEIEKLAAEVGEEAIQAGADKPACPRCRYYAADFKYRKCVFSRCPYDRQKDVFRKRKKVRSRNVRRLVKKEG